MARPRVHLLIALGLGLWQWRRHRRWPAALAPLISGFLIDLDHLLDYRPGRRAGHRLILPLHGWEYLLPLAWLERRRPATGHGLTLGYLAHLLVDQVTNQISHPAAYSLFFRWRRGFSQTLFDPPGSPSGAWRQTPLRQLWRWF